MKKLLLLAALGGSLLFAQSPDNGDYKITGSLDMTSGNWVAPFVPATSDPSGSCSHNYQIVIDGSGSLFACLSGTWSSLSGSLSGLTTNAILKACSATTGCNSAVTDNGTNVTSSEPLIVQLGGASFSSILLSTAHTPASSSESCTTGTLVWDAGFLYLCKTANTWVRSPWATF